MLTWLPFWRTDLNPAFFKAVTKSAPDNFGSLTTHRHLKGIKHHFSGAGLGGSNSSGKGQVRNKLSCKTRIKVCKVTLKLQRNLV